MTVVLAIVAVQASLGALLFGTLLLDRTSGAAEPGDHPADIHLFRQRAR